MCGVTERGRLLGNPIESHKGHWAQDTEVNYLKTNLSVNESAADSVALSFDLPQRPSQRQEGSLPSLGAS